VRYSEEQPGNRPKKWRIVMAIALLLLTADTLLPHPSAPKSRVTMANFNRIRLKSYDSWKEPGMNRAQVEAILGPPGDYRTSLTLNSPRPPAPPKGGFGGTLTCLAWEGDTVSIHVFVDPAGIAEDKNSVNNMLAEPTASGYLLWQAKCVWRSLFP
jgi:hypothetical protein